MKQPVVNQYLDSNIIFVTVIKSLLFISLYILFIFLICTVVLHHKIVSKQNAINRAFSDPCYLERLRHITEAIELSNTTGSTESRQRASRHTRGTIRADTVPSPSPTPHFCSTQFTSDNGTVIEQCYAANDIMDLPETVLYSGQTIYSNGTLITRSRANEFFSSFSDSTLRFFRNDNMDVIYDNLVPGEPINTTGYCATPPVVEYFETTFNESEVAYVGAGVSFDVNKDDMIKVSFVVNMGNAAYLYKNEIYSTTRSPQFPENNNGHTNNHFAERLAGTNAVYSLSVVCDAPVSITCHDAPIFHSQYYINSTFSNKQYNGIPATNSEFGLRYVQNIVFTNINNTVQASYSRTDYIVEEKTAHAYFYAQESGAVRCHPVLIQDVPHLTVPLSPSQIISPSLTGPLLSPATCGRHLMPSAATGDTCSDQRLQNASNILNTADQIYCGTGPVPPGYTRWNDTLYPYAIQMCLSASSYSTSAANNPGIAAACRMANNRNLVMFGYTAELELITTSRQQPIDLSMRYSPGRGEQDEMVAKFIYPANTGYDWCHIDEHVNLHPYV